MEEEKKENKRKTVIIAFAVLAGFYLLTKVLNSISPNAGKQTYELHCGGCHGNDGKGLGGIVPPLADADWVKNHQDDLACVIKNGMKGEVTVNGKTYDQEMLGLPYLSEIQITNIINYINSSWGNDYGFVKVQTVEEQLKKCP
jgi:mono/diheme cytochrome c family protein